MSAGVGRERESIPRTSNHRVRFPQGQKSDCHTVAVSMTELSIALTTLIFYSNPNRDRARDTLVRRRFALILLLKLS
jgi:hypothetical protein